MLAFFRRLGWYLRRRRFDAELAEEMAFHRERAMADGATAEEARRLLGNSAQLGEAARAAWAFRPVEELAQDLRYAGRVLRARPGFTIASLVTLALGIGATTALASVLDAVLLRRLPYHEPGRLVQLLEIHVPRDRVQSIISPANALAWRDRVRPFEDLALYTWSGVTLTGDRPERINGLSVTTNLFSLLGTVPASGRGFAAEDTVPGAPRALVLSHELWVRRFQGDRGIVGRSVPIKGGSALIVGVMPRGFRRLEGEDFWEPLSVREELRTWAGRGAMGLARLRPDASLGQAERELAAAARALEAEHPRNAGWTARPVPLAEHVAGKAKPVLLLLAGAIGFVLLVAAANVANLNLGQALARRRELAVRSALGASRGRVLRQWLVEGLVLAVLGGGLGVLVAAGGVRLLVTSGIELIPRLEEVAVNLRVLALAFGITVAVGIVFGLAPALTLREGGQREVITGFQSAAGTAGAGRLRSALVVAQVALSLMLLAGAGLAIRSLRHILSEDPGFRAEGVAYVEIDLTDADFDTPERTERERVFVDRLVEGARALPGVTAAGLVDYLPPRTLTPGTSFFVVGEPEPAPGQAPVTQVLTADSGYFGAMGVALRAGRLFESADRSTTRKVVVVSEAFVRQLGGRAIGRQVHVSHWTPPDSAAEVVGVVADVRSDGVDATPRPMVYFPMAQQSRRYMHLVARTTGDPAQLVGPLRAVVAALDRNLPLLGQGTMTDRVRDSLAARRYPMVLLSMLAALALLLAAVGLYGVLSYMVAQRERELGVRRALGAGMVEVTRLVLAQALRLVAAGAALGLACALLTTRFLGGLLYGVEASDPATYGAVALLLAAVAGVAALIPALRAARVEPLTAMRSPP